jgi:predicted ABC-type ATPase
MFVPVEKIIPCDDVPKKYQEIAGEIVGVFLAQTKEKKHPFLEVIAGVTGAGKSAYARKLHAKLGEQGKTVALVNFDDIMERLPGYQMRRVANNAAAYKEYRKVAQAIGYHVVNSLIAHRRSFILDHGASLPSHVDLVRHCEQEKGYKVFVDFLSCGLETAQKRIQRRDTKTKRKTPKGLVAAKQAILRRLLPELRKHATSYVQLNAEGTPPKPYMDRRDYYGLHRA